MLLNLFCITAYASSTGSIVDSIKGDISLNYIDDMSEAGDEELVYEGYDE